MGPHVRQCTSVDLGGGYHVEIIGIGKSPWTSRIMDLILVKRVGNSVETQLPEGPIPPEWLRSTSAKFDARPTIGRRVQMSKTRVEVHRYFMGWENFFFPFRSELTALFSMGNHPAGLQQGAPSGGSAELETDLSHILDQPGLAARPCVQSPLETFLMAVLGTATAGLVGCPWRFWQPPILPHPRHCGWLCAGCSISCAASTC
jgi:phosphonate transport system permease protein